ncbi:MAG: urea ABC transporter permease subunit UrtC [Thermoleophilaceae bacterium]|jgi:urea transport system permease protein|nr:urea ABC transporter permease subunit UrtC [Thermoleophilaceae bacterium]
MSRLAGTLAAGDARWGFLIRFLVVAAAMLLLAPAVLSDFRLSLLAKFLCFAIVAVGIGLAWGQGGMLVLGQGLFFGLGGYSMGMYMKLEEAGPGQLPDFMVWSGVESLPAVWEPFRHAWFALPMAVLLPMAVAAVLGTLVFRQRVRGAYFAILSQGLAAAFVIVLVGQQGLTGGTNGLTNFTQLFGLDLTAQANASILYTMVALGLLAVFLIARQLVASRYGRVLVAVRDSEDRVRFLGYDPTRIKVVAYTAAAGMAGLAGAMFVPIVGIISPALLGILPSIEMVIWVALGGRAVLAWAAGGAVLVNWVKTGLSERFPSGWLYLFGMVFVVVIAFAPKGMAGIGEYVRAGLGRPGAVRLGPRARDRATARDRAAQEPA